MVRANTGQHTFVPARVSHWHRVTWPEVLFALALVAAPLALGSVHVIAQVALAAVLLAAFIGAAWKLSGDKREVRVGWVGIGLFVALAWSFLQWLPWPAGVVEALAPVSYAARAEAARLAGLEVPTWMPLAIDAGRTAAGIVTLLAVALAYLCATSLRQDSNARARITNYVEVAALAVLASGVFHAALGLDRIWGVYAPQTMPLTAFPTSFVNPNHAAALMMLGAIVAFGASLSPDRSQRWHLAVGVLLSSGVLASLSRANALLLIAGLGLLTVPPLFLRAFREARGQLLRLLIGALACCFVAVVLIGPERWLNELASLEDKGLSGQGIFTYCWAVASQVVGLSPWVGLGAGNFGNASTAFAGSIHDPFLAYAHQAPMQVLSDLGVIVGALVLVLVVVGVARAGWRSLVGGRAQRGDLPTWAVAVGLVALGLQNLVDFSLWIPGVGLPAAAMCGLLVEQSWHANKDPRRLWFPAWRWPAWASLVPLGIGIVTAVPALRERPEAWKATATEALAGRQDGAVARVDRAALVMAHPHDYLALDLAAALAEAAGEREEVRGWLARALTYAPHDPTTLAAATRFRMKDLAEGPSALGEIGRLLDALDPDATGEARALELVLAAPQAVQEGYFARSAARVVAGARRLVEQGQRERADKLLVWAIARARPDDAAVVDLYRELGSYRWTDAPFLKKLATTCLTNAVASSNERAPVELRPDHARWEQLGYLYQARVEALEGRAPNAYRLFLAAADALPGEATIPLLEAGKAARELGRGDWLDDVMARLATPDATWGAWQRGEYHVLRSQQLEDRHELDAAIREMHEALRHLGSVPALHERLATLYERAGDDEAAARARARATSP